MTPTKKTCITPEGLERKLHRLIARELQRVNPYLYAELEQKALDTLNFDQADPFAQVPQRFTPATRKARALKHALREQAIEARFHPVMKPLLTQRSEVPAQFEPSTIVKQRRKAPQKQIGSKE